MRRFFVTPRETGDWRERLKYAIIQLWKRKIQDYLLEDEDINEFMKYFNIMLSFAQSQEKNMLLRWQDEFVK